MNTKIIIAYNDKIFAKKIAGYISNEVSIVAFVSLAGEKLDNIQGVGTITPDQIPTIEYDYILLLWGDDSTRDELTNLLLKISQAKEENVLDFYKLYVLSLQLPKVKRMMLNPAYDNLDGLVLGMSHAECGIVSKMLPGKAMNLATGAQDLFYNLKVLEYCISNYPEKIRTLSYVIIDMWDYPYFNYDVSRSSEAVNYYINYDGWDEDEHNFSSNIEFDMSFKEILNAKYRVKKEEEERIGTLKRLIPNLYSIMDYEDVSDDFKVKYLTHSMPEGCTEGYSINNSISNKRFEDTICENIDYFEKILNNLFLLNPKIKINLVLLPRYIEVEEKTDISNAEWKKFFYDTLNKFSKEYDFEIYDFKPVREISEKKEYYRDLAHLNVTGAKVFTEGMINTIFSTEELKELGYKKELKIQFSDVADDEWCELIYNLLAEEYDLKISDTPDVLFYSTEGDEFWEYKCPRIFFSESNIVPNFNEADYALSLFDIKYGDRHFTISNGWRVNEDELNRVRDYLQKIVKTRREYNKDPMGCSVHEELEREIRINNIMKRYFKV